MTHDLDKGQETARKEFEAWAKRKGAPLAKVINNLGKIVYRNWCVQDAFEAWQAATAKAEEKLKMGKEALDKASRLINWFDDKEPRYNGRAGDTINEVKLSIKKALATIEGEIT